MLMIAFDHVDSSMWYEWKSAGCFSKEKSPYVEMSVSRSDPWLIYGKSISC